MIRLLVIRHGSTEWNEADRIQGRTDVPLSDVGKTHLASAHLGPSWAGVACVSSPLVRAMDTARLLGLDPIPEPRLIEMAWGEWEGRRLADLRAELGEGMALNESRGLDFRPPGGESPRDVQERLRPLLRTLSAPTVAVTHKGVLRALYSLATGWDMKRKAPDKLLDSHAHSFLVDAGGSVSIDRINMPLATAP